MGNNLVFILSFLLISYSFGQSLVTEEETQRAAVKYARLFLNYNDMSQANAVSMKSYTENSHVIMREVEFDNGLCILFSAHKNCLPVLLYSEDKPVLDNLNDLPGGLRDFMDNYAKTILYAFDSLRSSHIHPEWILLLDSTNTANDSRSGTNIYGPLLTTVWGQTGSNCGFVHNAFNHFVPKTDDDCVYDTCPTGCVATAMAQIMKYWNYPVYRPERKEQFDWCNMPDTLYKKRLDSVTNTYVINNSFERERDAIARLMADCGSAAKMDYCFYQCNSFTFPIDARNALVDTFGYHPEAVRRLRSSYSTNNWKNMVISNLRSGIPILYAGVSWKTKEFDMNGHAFVCDGYNESTDKFHFNWGHGGNNNSWCTIDSIIEGSYNWNHLERAVFNIHPNTTQDYCNFEIPLWTHYYYYYSIYGNTTPAPYANVPKTFTRLISVPNDPQFQSSWRTIPTGATSEYAAHEEILLLDGFLAEAGSDFYAHIVPCESCDDRMVNGEISNVVEGGNDNPTDTLSAPKSWKTETIQSDDAALTVYPNPTDDLLFVELRGAEIARVALYDLQGRMVTGAGAHPGAPQQGTTATMNMRNVPAGVYLLRVTGADGKEYHRKIMKR